MNSRKRRNVARRRTTGVPNVLVVVGTRPESIKLAPLVHALGRAGGVRATVVNSGQHRNAVRATLAELGVVADVELPPMVPAQNVASAVGGMRGALRDVIERHEPDVVCVQGDTLTAYAAARAAADAARVVAHIEAGLRVDDLADPFPEEWFRRRIASHAALHFAPTHAAVANLRAEGIANERIRCVGNPGIDSLRAVLAELAGSAPLDRDRRRVIVTLHRRENLDANADLVCRALLRLADARRDLRILLPVHPNPRVAGRLHRWLGGHARIALVAPLAYRPFIAAAAGAGLIISDSGGIQEEAAHLGTPLLVPRASTERPECLATGFVRLTSLDEDAIVGHAVDMLSERPRDALPIDARAPFGDGFASERIARVLAHVLGTSADRVPAAWSTGEPWGGMPAFA